LADRFGEPDVRKIAALPASLIRHWEAFYSLVDKASSESDASSPDDPLSAPASSDVDAQCAAVMRALK